MAIHGATMHSACNFCSKKRKDTDKDWKNTIMVIVDEISFITKSDFELLNDVLNTKADSPNGTIFGNLQMVFAGDFCQLKPPLIGSYLLYVYKDCALCHH